MLQMPDRCVCCGEVIPEGLQVCPSCEEKNLCHHYAKGYCGITSEKCMGKICALYGGRVFSRRDTDGNDGR